MQEKRAPQGSFFVNWGPRKSVDFWGEGLAPSTSSQTVFELMYEEIKPEGAQCPMRRHKLSSSTT